MQVLIRRVFSEGRFVEEMLYASPDYGVPTGRLHHYHAAVMRTPNWFGSDMDAVGADFGVGRHTACSNEQDLSVTVDVATPEAIRTLLSDWRGRGEYDTLPALIDELRYRSDREPYATLLAAIECALVGGE